MKTKPIPIRIDSEDWDLLKLIADSTPDILGRPASRSLLVRVAVKQYIRRWKRGLKRNKT